MWRTAAAYNYAVRRGKQEEESNIRERVTSALLNEGGCNLWAEIKRIRAMISMY
jgi:hypothetical protein